MKIFRAEKQLDKQTALEICVFYLNSSKIYHFITVCFNKLKT